VCGGYNGKHGDITAYKTISVPSLPFNGLCLTGKPVITEEMSLGAERAFERFKRAIRSKVAR
jgi:hypothetical protein